MSIAADMFNPPIRQGRNMIAIKGKYVLAAIATAVAVSASITRADQPVVYGRAGIPVAEQRIQQLSQVQSSETARVGDRAVVWYGRAGFPVGSDAVVLAGSMPAPKAYAAGQTRAPTVYGRAGVPLPFPY
jgi:hypothetical protein